MQWYAYAQVARRDMISRNGRGRQLPDDADAVMCSENKLPKRTQGSNEKVGIRDVLTTACDGDVVTNEGPSLGPRICF